MSARSMMRVVLLGLAAIVAGLGQGTAQAAPPAVVDTISLGTNGSSPVGVAVNPNTNLIYVANCGFCDDEVCNGSLSNLCFWYGYPEDQNVSVFDGETHVMLAAIPVGTNPHGVAVNTTTNLIYVTNVGSDDVSVIDGETSTVEATIAVGSHPVRVAVNPSTNRIYVTNHGDDNVSVIDGATSSVVATVDVGDEPWGIAVNPSTNRIYVTNHGDDNVSVIDGATSSVVATVDVGDEPRGAAVDHITNRIYVTNYANSYSSTSSMSVIDGNTNTVVATFERGSYPSPFTEFVQPEGVAVDPTTHRIYVGCAESWHIYVFEYDEVEQTEVYQYFFFAHRIAFPSSNELVDVAINPNTKLIYAAEQESDLVSVAEDKGDEATVEIVMPMRYTPQGVDVNLSTNHIYVANPPGDTTSILDGDTGSVMANVFVAEPGWGFGSDGPWNPIDVAANATTNLIYVTNTGLYHRTVSVIDGATDSVVDAVNTGDTPWGVAVNPSTNRIYVTNYDSDNVSVIDGSNNTIVDTVDVGDWPKGVAVNSTTNRIYVANSGSDNVSVIDGDTNTVLATVDVGDGPKGVAVNSTTNRIYVSNYADGTVSVVNGVTNTVVATVAVGDAPQGLAVNPNTNRIYVANSGSDNVSVIDGSTNTVVSTVAVGDEPWDVAVNPDTNRIYVTNYADGTVSVIEPGDWDEDGVPDVEDNCLYVYNPDQLNSDAHRRPNGSQIPGEWASNPVMDNLGDACDTDSDNDWMLDTGTHPVLGIAGEDVGCGSGPTNPQLGDTDGDTVIDGAECALGSDPNDSGSKPSGSPPGDGDGDGLPAWLEDLLGSSDSDTDSDSPAGVKEFTDGYEFKGYGTDPTLVDTDGDGCADWIEIVDINGSRQANTVDVLLVIKRVYGQIPPSDSDYVFDINKSGAINTVDQTLAVQNSSLMKPHATCGEE